MPYDKDSGLFYTERTVRTGRFACRQHDPAFAKGHVGITRDEQPRGRRSLEQQATRQLLANLDRLDEHTFSTLPEAWAKTIFTKIEAAHLLSADIWKLFSRSAVRCRFEWIVRCKCRPLSYFVDYMNSPSMSWLSSVRLVGEAWEESHLAPLCNLDNLQALRIETKNDTQCLPDRLIRQWLQQISVKDNWKHFRLLTARGQRLLTPHGIQLLGQLPSMELVVLQNCGVKQQHIYDGSMMGWQHCKSRDRTSLLNASLSDEQLFSMFSRSRTTSVNDMPCIDVCIGFNELMYRLGDDPLISQDLVFVRDHSVPAMLPAPIPPSTQVDRSAKRARFKDTSRKQTGYLDMLSSSQP